jgi:uncharacterized membrane protein YecN with MAPEG domain
MTTATLCTAVLGLLVFGLGLGVSAQRNKTKTATGYRDDPADPLYKWVRAHGNTVEYAPMLGVLMLSLGARTPAAWVEWTMIAVTISRILLPIGLIAYPTMAKANPPRFVGAVGTYIGGLLLCIAMFVS